MDFSKLRTGEITAAIGGAALFLFLFFDWVGAEGTDESFSGWDYLGEDVTGFIVFLAAITAITLGILAATGRRNGIFGFPWGGPATVLGVLAFDIIVWRLFTVPDGAEVEFGIFLGLLAAAAVMAGGYMTLQDGGRDPLGIGGAPSSTATTARATATKKPAAKKKAAAKRKAAARRR